MTDGKINLAEKFKGITEHWSPRIIGELNGQHVKLAKIKGEFVWHSHESADELFLVVHGDIELHFRDRVIHLAEGECCVVPRGVEHKPVAAKEAHILLFEPAGTVNTGDVVSERTVSDPDWI